MPTVLALIARSGKRRAAIRSRRSCFASPF